MVLGNMLIWGIFAGAFSLFGTLRSLGKREPTWLYRWFRPWRKQGEKGFIRRVEVALSRMNHLYALPLLSPMIGYGVAWAVLSTTAYVGWTPFMVGMMLGYAGGLAIAYPLDISKTVTAYRQRIADFAAKKLAQRVRPELSNDILVRLAQHSDPMLRLAAAKGLRELGTKEGSDALKLLGDDKDQQVAVVARDAYNDLSQVYRGVGLLSVKTLDKYCPEHAYHLQQVRNRKKQRREESQLRLEEITAQIDEIVFSQLHLRRSFPDVYCVNCLARAESQNYEEWEWVRCRSCHEVHGLRAGVRKVVGRIGGEADGEVHDGTLVLPMWDDVQRKGIGGELNVLEVVGGSPIQYDWAVSAVVAKMLDEGHAQGNRIKVVLVNNPPLEPNSLHLLHSLDESMVVDYGTR